MKKYLKFILGLTQKAGASQALLKNGTKNLFVIGEADKVGLITGLGSKPLTWPINLERDRDLCLNPTSFFKMIRNI